MTRTLLKHPAAAASEFVRARMVASVVNLTSGGGGPAIDYLEPPGDPGLFGPKSVCWRVHCDFTLMMAGGVSALMLQCLHPLALAGVWDHSTFRQDMLGRLRRTSSFVGGTTYASCRDAVALIEHVRQIHQRVIGTAPDGRAYAATDPELLTWVHVAEVSSFLRAHQRYARQPLSTVEQDRYFRETARVAEMLGARKVPKSAAAIERYLQNQRPQLVYSDRARAVHRILLAVPAPSLALKPFGLVVVQAGIDLLPDWAQQMVGARRGALLRRVAVRPAVRTMAATLRWALRNGVSVRAKQRVAAPARTTDGADSAEALEPV